MNCPSCNEKLNGTPKFCSNCGRSLSKSIVSAKHLLIILVLTGSVWFGIRSLSSNLIGTAPDKSYTEYLSDTAPDPALDQLRSATKLAPDSLQHWRALAKGIGEKLLSEKEPDITLMNEMVTVVEKILELDPEDSQALITLANINYNQRNFAKAKELYSRYLKIVPNDLHAKSTYASSLTFLGDFENALNILKEVIASDATYFLAHANIAITFAAQNRDADAILAAEAAIKYAPDQEGRDRFAEFIRQLKEPQSHDSIANHAATTSQNNTQSSLQELEKHIKANQVAGPKFVTSKLEKHILLLEFSDFPMELMPPFVRERFVSGIKDQLSKLMLTEQISTINFVDHSTGKLLHSEKIK